MSRPKPIKTNAFLIKAGATCACQHLQMARKGGIYGEVNPKNSIMNALAAVMWIRRIGQVRQSFIV